ncbi:MAG: hypothetical protein A2Y10_15255 [Planctomycetes bacterium GWF2_41_51]|nr:MAG: hypothetical protein A2Y10_15255 [Planctomycetes bacterium GWF2_41_51]HBG27737.1 hypothetical protein [Phycisphaerales bacterium]
MIKNSQLKRFLGPNETQVIARLTYERLFVITVKQFDEFFNFNTNTRKQIIYRLRKKRILTPITKGVYFFSPLESGPAGSRINEYLIPSLLFPRGNYYIGYSTMYNYYGFTDQLFQTFYILNTSRQRERIICGTLFKLVKISPNRMYGLEKIDIRDIKATVSDRERTLIDLIYFPDPIGGFRNAFHILKSQLKNGKTDVKKLIRYAMIFPSISTRKRIGFILEQCGISNALLMPLKKSIKTNALTTLYGSKSRKGPINPTWKVILDDTYKSK